MEDCPTFPQSEKDYLPKVGSFTTKYQQAHRDLAAGLSTVEGAEDALNAFARKCNDEAYRADRVVEECRAD